MRYFSGQVIIFVFILLIRDTFAQTPTLEYQVKASYLYNFLQFIQWSEDGSDDSQKFVVGILGADSFGVALDSLRGKRVQGREIEIRRFHSPEELKSCQVIFVSASEENREAQILQRLKERHILTIGETESFARNGGIISFVLHQNRIRFEINQSAAREANMKISSKLFRLALRVYERDN